GGWTGAASPIEGTRSVDPARNDIKETSMAEQMGRVVQVIGPVLDVEFEAEALPEIYNALEIKAAPENGGPEINLIAEVQQHIGRNQVRAVAMSSTDGVTRGMPVRDT